jgi:histidine triad (HIT) family protein
MATLFSKIISWEIPSYKIYEDEHIYAFLNIYPHSPGHTLIVPKKEVDHFSDVPEPYYSAIFLCAKKLSPILQKATWCSRICTMFSGFDIPHCHYHIVPCMSGKELDFSYAKQASQEDLESMQNAITTELYSSTNNL